MDYSSHWPTVQFVSDTQATQGPRTGISLPGHRVWTLSNLLSSVECTQLVNTAEDLQLSDVKKEYDPNYRDCDRVVFLCPSLAEQLWLRLLPHWQREDIQGVRPYGFGNHGIWKPAAVNPCIRVTRYSAGHHFQPHRDGSFVMTDDFRSVYTLQVYLNDAAEFQGGLTNFLPANSSQDAAPGPVAATVTPQRGLGLIFNHDIHHEGAKVESGVKYILRTDIMFQRINAFDGPGHRAYLSDPTYIEAEELYKQSIEIQREGDASGSTAAYLAAQEMQARLPSIPLWRQPSSSSSTIDKLPDVVLVHLLSYLKVGELVPKRIVNWRFCQAAEDSTLWAALYQTKWQTGVQQEQLYAALHLVRKAPPESEALLLDWYSLYRNRYHAERHMRILVFDIGSSMARIGCLVKRRISLLVGRQWNFRNPIKASFASIPSCIANCFGHFWGAGSGMKQYLVGHELTHTRDLFIVGPPGYEGQRWAISRDSAEGTLGTPDWEVMEVILRHMLAVGVKRDTNSWYRGPEAHPVVVVVPPYFNDEQRNHLQGFLLKTVSFPRVMLVNAAVAALAAQGVTTGIAVNAGPLLCCISAVVNGEVKRDTVVVRKTESPVQPLAPLVEDAVGADAELRQQLLDFILVHGAHAEECGTALSKDLPRGSKVHIRTPSTNPAVNAEDLPAEFAISDLDICDWEPMKGAVAIAAVSKKQNFLTHATSTAPSPQAL